MDKKLSNNDLINQIYDPFYHLGVRKDVSNPVKNSDAAILEVLVQGEEKNITKIHDELQKYLKEQDIKNIVVEELKTASTERGANYSFKVHFSEKATQADIQKLIVEAKKTLATLEEYKRLDMNVMKQHRAYGRFSTYNVESSDIQHIQNGVYEDYTETASALNGLEERIQEIFPKKQHATDENYQKMMAGFTALRDAELESLKTKALNDLDKGVVKHVQSAIKDYGFKSLKEAAEHSMSVGGGYSAREEVRKTDASKNAKRSA